MLNVVRRCRASGSYLVRGTVVLVVRSAQGLQDCLTRLRERDCVVLRDFAQQQLQELRRSPIEHNASLDAPLVAQKFAATRLRETASHGTRYTRY